MLGVCECCSLGLFLLVCPHLRLTAASQSPNRATQPFFQIKHQLLSLRLQLRQHALAHIIKNSCRCLDSNEPLTTRVHSWNMISSHAVLGFLLLVSKSNKTQCWRFEMPTKAHATPSTAQTGCLACRQWNRGLLAAGSCIQLHLASKDLGLRMHAPCTMHLSMNTITHQPMPCLLRIHLLPRQPTAPAHYRCNRVCC